MRLIYHLWAHQQLFRDYLTCLLHFRYLKQHYHYPPSPVSPSPSGCLCLRWNWMAVSPLKILLCVQIAFKILLQLYQLEILVVKRMYQLKSTVSARQSTTFEFYSFTWIYKFVLAQVNTPSDKYKLIKATDCIFCFLVVVSRVKQARGVPPHNSKENQCKSWMYKLM